VRLRGEVGGECWRWMMRVRVRPDTEVNSESVIVSLCFQRKWVNF
jgi:hypothetical protein